MRPRPEVARYFAGPCPSEPDDEMVVLRGVPWPEPATKPRAEVARDFAAPRSPGAVTEMVVLDGSLCGLLAELAHIKQRIEAQGRRRRFRRLTRWLTPLLRPWHRLAVGSKPRSTRPGSSGVWDPWIA